MSLQVQSDIYEFLNTLITWLFVGLGISVISLSFYRWGQLDNRKRLRFFRKLGKAINKLEDLEHGQRKEKFKGTTL